MVGMSEEAAFEVLRVYVEHDNGHVPIQRSGCNRQARLIVLGEDGRGAVPHPPCSAVSFR